MLPQLVILGRPISLYGLMAGLGFVAAVVCLIVLAPRRGIPSQRPLLILAIGLVPMAIGGSLLYGFTNLPYLMEVTSRIAEFDGPLEIVRAYGLGFSGMVFYGGMLAVLATVLVYCKLTGRPKGDYLDLFAVAVPLFSVFGRIGCFLGGCCFGVEWPGGIVYTQDPIAIANGVPRFPVQLLESAGDLVIFLIMLSLFRREALRGGLVYAYFLSYGTLRFFDEFLRGDVYRGFFGPFSTSQWISLILIATALIMLWRRRRRSGGLRSEDENSFDRGDAQRGAQAS